MRHLPPGTSKWNKIEHRLFAFIGMNGRATPLVSYRVIVDLTGTTTTDTGLPVRCELDSASYVTGVAVSDAELAAINLVREDFRGAWDHAGKPQPRRVSDRAVIS